MFLINKTIKRLANLFGLEIHRILPKKRGHGLVIPNATYSPWKTDGLFKKVFSMASNATLHDECQIYGLWKLVEQSAKLKDGNLIEIGVWRGGSGAVIAQQAKNCGIKEKVYLCDNFKGNVKVGVNDDPFYKGGDHADTSRQMVEELVFNQLKLDNVEILEGIFPEETGHQVEGLKFRFCHSDFGVYQASKDVLDWVWDKIIPGGMVVFSDFGHYACDGTVKLIEEEMNKKDRLVVCNLDGSAILVKL